MSEIEKLIGMCRACGASKLSGRLAEDPSRGDIGQAIAYLRGELDAIEEVIHNLAPESGTAPTVETVRTQPAAGLARWTGEPTAPRGELAGYTLWLKPYVMDGGIKGPVAYLWHAYLEPTQEAAMDRRRSYFAGRLGSSWATAKVLAVYRQGDAWDTREVAAASSGAEEDS